MWDDLEQRFPDKPIIKRGVGGCELSHVVDYYTPSILFPYKPSKIFIYAGENDIASNKSADDVAKNFERLWHMIRLQLPETKIYFMAIKPSNSRTKHFSEFNKANLLVKQFLKGKPLSKYIDMASPVLNKAGQPDSALFKNDQLHLNNKGYDKWHKKLKSYL
jgi:lysophospholipase L1-like esterase